MVLLPAPAPRLAQAGRPQNGDGLEQRGGHLSAAGLGCSSGLPDDLAHVMSRELQGALGLARRGVAFCALPQPYPHPVFSPPGGNEVLPP